jgi:hypothetical protein
MASEAHQATFLRIGPYVGYYPALRSCAGVTTPGSVVAVIPLAPVTTGLTTALGDVILDLRVVVQRTRDWVHHSATSASRHFLDQATRQISTAKLFRTSRCGCVHSQEWRRMQASSDVPFRSAKPPLRFQADLQSDASRNCRAQTNAPPRSEPTLA